MWFQISKIARRSIFLNIDDEQFTKDEVTDCSDFPWVCEKCGLRRISHKHGRKGGQDVISDFPWVCEKCGLRRLPQITTRVSAALTSSPLHPAAIGHVPTHGLLRRLR